MKKKPLLLILAFLVLALSSCGDNGRVTDLSLKSDKTQLLTTETAEVTLTILPGDVKDIDLTWESSDASVFTVEGPARSDGSTASAAVTPAGPGTAVLTVTSENGTSAQLNISVRAPIEVANVTLSRSNLTLLLGETADLTYTFSPSNADFAEITVTSSDSSVASFADGTVTALTEGTTVITASAPNGVKAECQVTVRAPIEVTSVNAGPDINLVIGGTQSFSPVIAPQNADDKSCTVASSDESVAVVSSNTVTAVGAGTAVITVTASNGVSGSFTVNVRAPIEVSSVSISETSLTLLLGDTTILTASVSPDNADNKTLTWSSSDSSILIVNSGTVTGVKEGTATVTVTASNGVSASCEVTVQKMSPELLDDLLRQQPLYVSSTKYVVQSDRWKSLYPDMLQAVITNEGTDTIKNAVVAFVAWDSNGLPIKIVPEHNYYGGSYLIKCSFNDVNLLPGSSYGSNSGMSLYDSEQTPVGSFKACVVSYETFDGTTWENPYYEKFVEMYSEKLRP